MQATRWGQRAAPRLPRAEGARRRRLRRRRARGGGGAGRKRTPQRAGKGRRGGRRGRQASNSGRGAGAAGGADRPPKNPGPAPRLACTGWVRVRGGARRRGNGPRARAALRRAESRRPGRQRAGAPGAPPRAGRRAAARPARLQSGHVPPGRVTCPLHPVTCPFRWPCRSPSGAPRPRRPRRPNCTGTCCRRRRPGGFGWVPECGCAGAATLLLAPAPHA
jgi:hypothetical protein